MILLGLYSCISKSRNKLLERQYFCFCFDLVSSLATDLNIWLVDIFKKEYTIIHHVQNNKEALY